VKKSKSLTYIFSTLSTFLSLLLAWQPSICLAADGQSAAADVPPANVDNPSTASEPKYQSVNVVAPSDKEAGTSAPQLRREQRVAPKYSDSTGTSALPAPSRTMVPRELRPMPAQGSSQVEFDPTNQAGSSAAGWQPPDLRGAISPPSSQQAGTPSTSASSAQPAAPAGSEEATAAIDTDFAKHKATTAAIKRGFPSEPSGASTDKTPAVLTKDAPAGPGPSAVTSNSDRLDEIELNHPPLQSLISVNNYLNPFQLDATTSGVMSLREVLLYGLEQNLDVAISRTNSKAYQNAFYSSLGNFLPDPTFGYSDYFTSGRIGFPVAVSQLFGSSALATASATSSTSAAGLSSNSNTTTIRVHHPFEIMHGGVDFYAYRGGSILFGALQAKHNYKAAKLQEKASLRDMLMTVTQNYYNLVLAEALLQIRIQAVRTSNEQLRRNLDRFHSGLATNLDVLQSRTQLSRDRQNLVDQQTNRRSSSISLAQSLYMNLGEDIIPVELNVKKVRLVDPRLNIADFLQLAIDNRPELKQYEELRLAAKRAIMVAAANLQPTVLLSAAEYGIGPPSNVQGLGLFSVNINWRLKGFGTVDAFNVNQARWQARQAHLNAEKELQTVLGQVRNSYLQILDKERNIEEASNEVESSLEELRLAELRKSSGLGINLDIITAQRDYTQALVDKAQAIIQFNIAQAQLVHDMGLISVDALTAGRLLSKSTPARK
jgi:outer membrane protein